MTAPRGPMPPPIPVSNDRISGGFALEPVVLFVVIVAIIAVLVR